jgi:uncharacterized membrane protein
MECESMWPEQVMPSETSRIEAFSDGVFSIAATLLILEIKIPPAAQANLSTQLLQQWPSYCAFLLSFAFIGIMWVNHHRLFTHIRRSDNGLLFLNLLLLLGVVAVPFPTEVLAIHLRGSGARTAALVYQGTYVMIAVFFNLLWRYALSRNLLDHAASGEAAAAISRQYAGGPLLYMVCLAVAWISVGLSLILNAALAVFFAIPPRGMGKSRP